MTIISMIELLGLAKVLKGVADQPAEGLKVRGFLGNLFVFFITFIRNSSKIFNSTLY